MMGYRNKNLYHKYVCNKIKYLLLMIWEFCQNDEFVRICNMYNSLRSYYVGYALLKLTENDFYN